MLKLLLGIGKVDSVNDTRANKVNHGKKSAVENFDSI